MKAIVSYFFILMAISPCGSGLISSSTPQKIFTNSRQFIDQQKVVVRTTLVVASIAIYTKQNPQFIGSQLRQDILSGTIIFQVFLVVSLSVYLISNCFLYLTNDIISAQVGDWLAQLLTYEKTQQQQLSLNKDNGIHDDNKKRSRRRKWRSKQRIRPLLNDLKTFKVDDSRFVISTLLGAFWAGYVNPSVYALVESKLPGISIRLVLLKMLITCSILSTWGNYTTMMIRRFMKLTWEEGIKEAYPIFCQCLKSCRDDFMDVLADDLKIFPPYDILCYSVIPPQIRPVTNALVCSGWQCYMSIASANMTKPSSSEKAITV